LKPDDPDPFAAARADPLSGFFHRYADDGPRGLQVLMDATNRCNLRCVMCHFAYEVTRHEPLRQWSRDFLDRVERDVFPYAGHVQVSTGTEPLMWPDFPLLLDALRRTEVPVVEMITNGQLLTEELARKIVESGMTKVQFSLEGASRESYESIRVGGSFEQFQRGVGFLVAAREEAGSSLPRLQFDVTLMRSTAGQIEGILQMARRLRVEDLDFRHVVLLDGLDMERESFREDKAAFNRLMDRTRARAAELGLTVVLAPDDFRLDGTAGASAGETKGFPRDSPLPGGAVCWAPWRQTYIGPDGRVLPCPFWYTRDPMGNLRERSFLDVWEGPSYRRLRWSHLTDRPGVNCAQCPLRGTGKVDDENAFHAHDLEKVRSAARDPDPPAPLS